jgi:hypothetical protein
MYFRIMHDPDCPTCTLARVIEQTIGEEQDLW